MTSVVGVDEVGRGAIAGPLVAAAIVATGDGFPQGVKDSKELSPGRRSTLSKLIEEKAMVGVGSASPEEIDNIGLQQCNLLAIKRAVEVLINNDTHADLVLVDGKFSTSDLASILPGLNTRSVVKGDKKIPAISAASICAKVFRDGVMKELHSKNSFYGWASNAGYGTRDHIAALKERGYVQGVHRFSFKVRL